MRYDMLHSPISEGDPCGPDLDDIGDNEYGNYMLVAGGKLPARYFTGDTPFDKSSIDLDSELETIGGFLRRSRDIRLLTLEARFQILTGNIVGFSEAIQGIAVIVSEFWEKFLPLPYEGDNMMRQNTVEALEDPSQIMMPLQYAAIVSGAGSLSTVTYRTYMVASGKEKPRNGEEVLKLDVLVKSLKDERSTASVKEVHEAILAAVAALGTIRTAFIENAGYEFAPNYDKLIAALAAIDEVIVAQRPELAPAKPLVARAEGDGESDADAGDGAAAIVLQAVPNHQAARAALLATEAYFRRTEPSNPALILVHQAGILIGKPLTDALAALLPAAAAKAALRIDGGYEFTIDLARMKSITDDALTSPVPELPPEPEATPLPEPTPRLELAAPAVDAAPPADGEAADGAPADAASEPGPVAAPPPPPPPAPPVAAKPATPAPPANFLARSRADATGLMLGAEAFFRMVEPSSPIPLLLEKARGYLNRDFASIMNELAPPAPPK